VVLGLIDILKTTPSLACSEQEQKTMIARAKNLFIAWKIGWY
jgi:hypothetical protein